MQDLSHYIEYNNINIDYLAKAYMAISDIYLLKGELENADKNIKIALRANRRIKGGIEKMRKINKIKLQSLEKLK